MKLVVGLGNPGAKYEKTRHNAGYWWVDQLASITRVSFRRESRFQGWAAKVAGADELWLLKPETFMNLSGQSVAALAGYYKIAPQDVLVVHDELDLPAGGVKLKFGGGLGGHNGLKSIAQCLGTQDFWRLRIGIGHPRDQQSGECEVIDYVLHAPRAEEQVAIDEAMKRALNVWPLLVQGKTEQAMLKLHTKA
jgi:PTH1 family peptidyl-tRNA hydrolase